MDTLIKHEKLSCRAWNVLLNNGLAKCGFDHNVVDLDGIAAMTDEMFLSLRNCGRKTLEEVEEFLADHGKKFADEAVAMDWATELWAGALKAHGLWMKSKMLRKKGPSKYDTAAITFLSTRIEEMIKAGAS